uniref:Uncharacterized protein n=1 Tax=Pipistrellus kuhlii TaxID=59472 RepID=A0A7J7UGI2_PIPKU|nr:hypothetical protein mPipKuh1_009103 [Pipistrellus kuhlii]
MAPGLPSTAHLCLWPSELHSRTIKAHSFNQKVPLARPGFQGVRVPFTRSHSGRHCKDWPRPPSRHTFLWTLRCNPHTRCPRGTPLPHLINSGCSSLLSDLGDVWTAEAGRECCLSTFNCFLQTGQEGLWVWGPLWSENRSGWRLLGEQCRQEDQAAGSTLEPGLSKAAPKGPRMPVRRCWRVGRRSVEAGGGQG